MKKKIAIISCVILVILGCIPFLKMEGTKVYFLSKEELQQRFTWFISDMKERFPVVEEATQNSIDSEEEENKANNLNENQEQMETLETVEMAKNISKSKYEKPEYDFITIYAKGEFGQYKNIYIDVTDAEDGYADIYDSETKDLTVYLFTEDATRQIVELTNDLTDHNKDCILHQSVDDAMYRDAKSTPSWDFMLSGWGHEYFRQGANYGQYPDGWNEYIDGLVNILTTQNDDSYIKVREASDYDNEITDIDEIEYGTFSSYDKNTGVRSYYDVAIHEDSAWLRMWDNSRTEHYEYELNKTQKAELLNLIGNYCKDYVQCMDVEERSKDDTLLWEASLENDDGYFFDLYSYNHYPENWDTFIQNLNASKTSSYHIEYDYENLND